MLRRLIVNADDFGHSPGVSAGIIEAHLKGIVTSTSLMINMPYAEAALRAAAEQAPRLGIGLHLNVTEGRPISDPGRIPALLGPDGKFLGPEELYRRLDSVPYEQLESELHAQAAAFLKLAGRAPDHLDSHHHITYRTEKIFAAMGSVARQYQRRMRWPLPPEGFAEATDFDPAALAAWDEFEAVGPDGMIGSFYGDKTTLGDLLNLLVAVPEGQVELMVHPGRVDDELRALSSYVDERERELINLCHPSAREVCNAEFIQLISFADLIE